jgi:hypothetical protein
MFIAKGYYRSGTGTANRNLKLQRGAIAAEFPEIASYHLEGTINVRFEPAIIVSKGDLRTSAICWQSQGRDEVFELLRVKLSFQNQPDRVAALMYIAHNSPHRFDPHLHEFLAEKFVPGLRHDVAIVMECDRDFIDLPYLDARQGRSGKPLLARMFVIGDKCAGF